MVPVGKIFVDGDLKRVGVEREGVLFLQGFVEGAGRVRVDFERFGGEPALVFPTTIQR